MIRIDEWCKRGRLDREFSIRWYSDPVGLRISGLIGIGTELFILMVCSVLNALQTYLILNVFLMNLFLLISILYRRWYLGPTISMKG